MEEIYYGLKYNQYLSHNVLNHSLIGLTTQAANMAASTVGMKTYVEMNFTAFRYSSKIL